jgi:hypothetical protein
MGRMLSHGEIMRFRREHGHKLEARSGSTAR